jgi:Iron-containing redox enzyme
MNYTAQILTLADKVVAQFNQTRPIQFLLSDALAIRHYAEILSQFHHYTKENPGFQAMAATKLRGKDRNFVRKMFLHATAEVGHDQLALQDLQALGNPTDVVSFKNPLPTTLPLIAFPTYQLSMRNPIGYLGCILFLETLPVRSGPGYMARLQAIGVPDEAMTFIADHASVDVQHNKLMREYLDNLVQTQEDCASVEYCLQAMSVFYEGMLWGAICQADAPRDWGVAYEEC